MPMANKSLWATRISHPRSFSFYSSSSFPFLKDHRRTVPSSLPCVYAKQEHSSRGGLTCKTKTSLTFIFCPTMKIPFFPFFFFFLLDAFPSSLLFAFISFDVWEFYWSRRRCTAVGAPYATVSHSANYVNISNVMRCEALNWSHSAQFTTTLLCVFLQLLRPGPILASPAICIPIKKRELGTIINFLWGSSNRPAAAVDFKFNDLITTTNDARTSSEIPFCFFF